MGVYGDNRYAKSILPEKFITIITKQFRTFSFMKRNNHFVASKIETLIR